MLFSPFHHRSCIGLIGVPVEPDALHAVLRLCLRFTRNHQHALMFSELGGPRLLLSLTQRSSFNGFPLLATLLLRHIFESKSVLTNTMEKVRTQWQSSVIVFITLIIPALPK